jgi:endopeptidase La
MDSDSIKVLLGTFYLTLDTYIAISKTIKKNKLTGMKLKQFLRQLKQHGPLLKFSTNKKIRSRDFNELKKLNKLIHIKVVSSLIKQMTKDSKILKYIDTKIKELRIIIDNSEKIVCESGKGGSGKNVKFLKRKFKSEDDGSEDGSEEDSDEDSDGEYLPENDLESEEEIDDESSEVESLDEESSDAVMDEESDENDGSDEDTDEDSDEDSEDLYDSDENEEKKTNVEKKRRKLNNNKSKDIKTKRKQSSENRIKKKNSEKNKKFVAEYFKKIENGKADECKMNKNYYDKLSNEEKKKFIDEVVKMKTEVGTMPIIYKVLLSKIPNASKKDIMDRLYQCGDMLGEFPKLNEWINGILNVPFGIYVQPEVSHDSPSHKIVAYLDEAKECMEQAVHGHQEAKQKIMQFVAQTVSNKNPKGLILGIEGPMGNGKTTLIENGFAKAIKRPFATIPLGGISDGTFLEGHGYTYEGSRWGAIVNVLMSKNCMNPIIYMDELDKVSTTQQGQEIINLLIHLVDPSQNSHFRDKYFDGIEFDLSQAIFIFSYNDRDLINPVLMDRITNLKTRGFRLPEKVIITNKYLLKNIFNDVGMEEKNISFAEGVIEWIIKTYTFEGGVRGLKQILYDIIREINFRSLSNKKNILPFTITKKLLENDFMKNMFQIVFDKIHKTQEIGKINGLYATCNDTGGLVVIEASWVPSDSRLALTLTGRQGDVMKESMSVAKTLAWKLLSDDDKKKWLTLWDKSGVFQGIHIHCPDGSTSKDGPSAGAAITTVIHSILSEKRIKNNVALTGEIDLSGKVSMIGGLESKLFGAKTAGASIVLCPRENKRDLKKIKEEHPTLFNENFKVKLVSNIQQVFNEMFVCETNQSPIV